MVGLPKRVGIMVLPGAVLFPHCLLPLRIFEPRYRKMLAEALDSHRMFAVGTPDWEGGGRRPRAVAGLGLVRACVENEDGTSNLILQGVARVRFPKFLRVRPLFEGCPELVRSEGGLSQEGERLLRRLVADVLVMAEERGDLPDGLEGFLREIREAETLMDVVAGTFLRDEQRRQELLETGEVELRVRRLAMAIREEYPNLKSL